MRKGFIKDHEDIEKTRAGQRKNAVTDVNVRCKIAEEEMSELT